MTSEYNGDILVSDMTNMTLGSRIKWRRDQLDMTQEELADLLGVVQQSVQKWEAGRSRPRGKRMDALTAALQVSEAWLTGRDDNIPELTNKMLNREQPAATKDEEIAPGVIRRYGSDGRSYFVLTATRGSTAGQSRVYAGAARRHISKLVKEHVSSPELQEAFERPIEFHDELKADGWVLPRHVDFVGKHFVIEMKAYSLRGKAMIFQEANRLQSTLWRLSTLSRIDDTDRIYMLALVGDEKPASEDDEDAPAMTERAANLLAQLAQEAELHGVDVHYFKNPEDVAEFINQGEDPRYYMGFNDIPDFPPLKK